MENEYKWVRYGGYLDKDGKFQVGVIPDEAERILDDWETLRREAAEKRSELIPTDR